MHGPFRLITWSVLSLTWSVLSCRGPFCPWSVLSMVRYVPNSYLKLCSNQLNSADTGRKRHSVTMNQRIILGEYDYSSDKSPGSLLGKCWPAKLAICVQMEA